MSRFTDTEAAAEFIARADSRCTSRQVMEAIAFFARDAQEAERLWSGDGIGEIANLSDIWEHATGNGRLDDADLYWGDRTLAEIVTEF
jgi:hypothetical protein